MKSFIYFLRKEIIYLESHIIQLHYCEIIHLESQIIWCSNFKYEYREVFRNLNMSVYNIRNLYIHIKFKKCKKNMSIISIRDENQNIFFL